MSIVNDDCTAMYIDQVIVKVNVVEKRKEGGVRKWGRERGWNI